MNKIKQYLSAIHQWFVDNVWKPSWTKFLSYTAGIPAALLTVGQYVSSWMQDSTIQSYMLQFDIPSWVPTTLTAISLLYYIASGRK